MVVEKEPTNVDGKEILVGIKVVVKVQEVARPIETEEGQVQIAHHTDN